ncbi:hypothetical protein L1049_006549 [Liquidambar formosana]|uniref:Apyrase 6 n=1 Tax=Liquidambar formosana TaxID=63359 RepID=A0AAP0RHE7_LIQFO
MRRLTARTPKLPHAMDSTTKLQFRPNTTPSRSTLFSRPSSKHSKSNFLIAIAIAAALAVFFYLFVVVRGSRYVTKKKFGIVIDGGSTGTRIHVFEYGIEGGAPVFDLGKSGLASMKVNPGLSSYAEDPEGAGRSLVELLDFGKGRVPRVYWGGTEIRLMATAGLRLLDLGVQEAILESCRRVLRSSGFKFQDDWASVITGSDEGIYAWVVANYALGTLGGDPQKTTGIIELGGASAQVTFVSSEPMPPEFSHTLSFGNFTYNLYSHSFLHFGQNAAFDSLRDSLVSRDIKLSTESLQKGISIDPCTPKGYSHNMKSWNFSPDSLAEKKYSSTLHPRGSFSECRSAALMLLQKGKEECSYQHCYVGSTFIPKLHGRFLATENFFYTSKFFELAPRAFLSDLMMAGQHFCQEDWSELKRKYHPLEEEDLLRYCFSSAYIVALLHDSLGIALDDERIAVANQVRDIPLDWALGAFILQSTANLDVEHPDWISTIVGDDSPTHLSLFVISLLLLLTAWTASKCRKPQLKTIYDLEKGRYIVTRVR